MVRQLSWWWRKKAVFRRHVACIWPNWSPRQNIGCVRIWSGISDWIVCYHNLVVSQDFVMLYIDVCRGLSGLFVCESYDNLDVQVGGWWTTCGNCMNMTFGSIYSEPSTTHAKEVRKKHWMLQQKATFVIMQIWTADVPKAKWIYKNFCVVTCQHHALLPPLMYVLQVNNLQAMHHWSINQKTSYKHVSIIVF